LCLNGLAGKLRVGIAIDLYRAIPIIGILYKLHIR